MCQESLIWITFFVKYDACICELRKKWKQSIPQIGSYLRLIFQRILDWQLHCTSQDKDPRCPVILWQEVFSKGMWVQEVYLKTTAYATARTTTLLRLTIQSAYCCSFSTKVRIYRVHHCSLLDTGFLVGSLCLWVCIWCKDFGFSKKWFAFWSETWKWGDFRHEMWATCTNTIFKSCYDTEKCLSHIEVLAKQKEKSNREKRTPNGTAISQWSLSKWWWRQKETSFHGNCLRQHQQQYKVLYDNR